MKHNIGVSQLKSNTFFLQAYLHKEPTEFEIFIFTGSGVAWGTSRRSPFPQPKNDRKDDFIFHCYIIHKNWAQFATNSFKVNFLYNFWTEISNIISL